MRTKNTLKTFLYGILFTSIIAVLGLVKTKILLDYLGDEYVGVYQLFYQIYLYLSLVDGGIGASITYHLYKPINEKKEKEINSIVAGAKSYFQKIGIIVIILGIIISFGIMFFIKETTISAWYIKICFILFIISSAISYFTSAHAILYEAEQKLYKSSNLNHLLSIGENIVAIVVALLGGKLLTILTIFLGLSIIKNIILVAISRRDHQYLKKEVKKKDLSFKKEANNLIVNKISILVYENINVIIVSKYLGLTAVFIYTAYNQIINMLTQMIQRFNNALLPSVGNLLVSEKKKAKATFIELNALLFFGGSLLFVPLFYMLSPFIGLWYGKEYMVTTIICLFFVLVLYFNIIKISLETYIKAAGEFKSIRNISLYQSIICIVLALLLVNKFGISGVLFATIFSFITGTFCNYPRIICQKIINDKTFNYYKKCFKYLLGLGLNIFICYWVSKYLVNSNLFMWFVNGAVIFAINFFLTVAYYYLTKEMIFWERIKFLLKNLNFKFHKPKKGLSGN